MSGNPGTKVDPKDPQVRKLVYNMYRGILGDYNNKANDIVSNLPKEMVTEDQGISKQLESMIRQSQQIAANNTPSYSIHTDAVNGAPPPPPPPLTAGTIPAVRLKSEIPERGKEPPAAIQNAMMTKDKKPFTYTPGGLDLSEIRSPRMARRITRNQMNPEVAHLPPTPQETQQASPRQPLPPAALAAMQPALPVSVFPQQQIPITKQYGKANSSSAAPPPAPPAPPPMSQDPKFRAPVSNGVTNGQRFSTPSSEMNTNQSRVNQAPGSLYIPPLTKQDSGAPQSPPWMQRQNSTPKEVPVWVHRETAPSPTFNQQPRIVPTQVDSKETSSSQGNTRIIPIKIEVSQQPQYNNQISSPLSPQTQNPSQQYQQQSHQYQQQNPQYQQSNHQYQQSSQQYHQPSQQYQQPSQQYQQQNQVYQQVQQPQQQQQQQQQQQRWPVYVPNKFNQPQSPTNENGGPIQSRSFKVLQKITDTDNNEGIRQDYPDASTYNTAGVPLSQLRKMHLSDDDKALMDKVKSQVTNAIEHPEEAEQNPRYRGSNIPSRVFKILDDSVDDDIFLHSEPDPRYRGAAIPSKAFRMLQSMTSGTSSYQFGVPKSSGNEDYSQNSPVRSGTPQYEQANGHSRQFVPASQQEHVQEPRKYTGGTIPSRSFRMLQAMTVHNPADGRTNESVELGVSGPHPPKTLPSPPTHPKIDEYLFNLPADLVRPLSLPQTLPEIEQFWNQYNSLRNYVIEMHSRGPSPVPSHLVNVDAAPLDTKEPVTLRTNSETEEGLSIIHSHEQLLDTKSTVHINGSPTKLGSVGVDEKRENLLIKPSQESTENKCLTNDPTKLILEKEPDLRGTIESDDGETAVKNIVIKTNAGRNCSGERPRSPKCSEKETNASKVWSDVSFTIKSSKNPSNDESLQDLERNEQSYAIEETIEAIDSLVNSPTTHQTIRLKSRVPTLSLPTEFQGEIKSSDDYFMDVNESLGVIATSSSSIQRDTMTPTFSIGVSAKNKDSKNFNEFNFEPVESAPVKNSTSVVHEKPDLRGSDRKFIESPVEFWMKIEQCIDSDAVLGKNSHLNANEGKEICANGVVNNHTFLQNHSVKSLAQEEYHTESYQSCDSPIDFWKEINKDDDERFQRAPSKMTNIICSEYENLVTETDSEKNVPSFGEEQGIPEGLPINSLCPEMVSASETNEKMKRKDEKEVISDDVPDDGKDMLLEKLNKPDFESEIHPAFLENESNSSDDFWRQLDTSDSGESLSQSAGTSDSESDDFNDSSDWRAWFIDTNVNVSTTMKTGEAYAEINFEKPKSPTSDFMPPKIVKNVDITENNKNQMDSVSREKCSNPNFTINPEEDSAIDFWKILNENETNDDLLIKNSIHSFKKVEHRYSDDIVVNTSNDTFMQSSKKTTQVSRNENNSEITFINEASEDSGCNTHINNERENKTSIADCGKDSEEIFTITENIGDEKCPGGVGNKILFFEKRSKENCQDLTNANHNFTNEAFTKCNLVSADESHEKSYNGKLRIRESNNHRNRIFEAYENSKKRKSKERENWIEEKENDLPVIKVCDDDPESRSRESEDDSGVTSDGSRPNNDVSDVTRRRRVKKYQRASTHSRLFQILVTEDQNSSAGTPTLQPKVASNDQDGDLSASSGFNSPTCVFARNLSEREKMSESKAPPAGPYDTTVPDAGHNFITNDSSRRCSWYDFDESLQDRPGESEY